MIGVGFYKIERGEGFVRHEELRNELREKVKKGKYELQEIGGRQVNPEEKSRIDGKIESLNLAIGWMGGIRKYRIEL